MGESTISITMAIFNSYVSHYQRVSANNIRSSHPLPAQFPLVLLPRDLFTWLDRMKPAENGRPTPEHPPILRDTHTHTQTHGHTDTRTHGHTDTHTHTRTYIIIIYYFIYNYIYIHVYIYIYTCMCVYIQLKRPQNY